MLSCDRLRVWLILLIHDVGLVNVYPDNIFSHGRMYTLLFQLASNHPFPKCYFFYGLPPLALEPRHEKSCLCHMRTTKTLISQTFLRMFSLLLKELIFWFLFAFTAAGVVQCGGRITSTRSSYIAQFIFYFWSFELSVNILRNQK